MQRIMEIFLLCSMQLLTVPGMMSIGPESQKYQTVQAAGNASRHRDIKRMELRKAK